jgi:hypothetical protein
MKKLMLLIPAIAILAWAGKRRKKRYTTTKVIRK